MKYKEFMDTEYIIVNGIFDIRQDTDKNNNIIQRKCIKFVCRTPNNQIFEVVPHGTLEQREIWYKKRALFLGKELTVRYQELSEDGVPVFPIGVGIRDYE